MFYTLLYGSWALSFRFLLLKLYRFFAVVKWTAGMIKKGFDSGLLDKTLSGDEIKSVRLAWKSGATLKFISCNWPPEIFKGSWEVNFFSIFRVTVNAAKKEWNPNFQPVQAVPNFTSSIDPIQYWTFQAKDWEWVYFGAIFLRLWRKFGVVDILWRSAILDVKLKCLKGRVDGERHLVSTH